MIRVGIPSSFPRFSTAAVAMGAPMLISANAMRRKDKPGFRRPAADLFAGGNVALDSAGFVAMFRYGGYPWSVDEYLDLVASHPWAWWASMDLCCEPEIAADDAEVHRRQAETVRMLGECRRAAADRGMPPPMPVLQGWNAVDYERCAAMIGDLPHLVGLGSMCRRQLGGQTGVHAVLAHLDRRLPRGVKLHLFGVKGAAVGQLRGHPRIASIDSMAWDVAARREREPGEPYSVDTRIKFMQRWYGKQRRSLSLFGAAA